jgi:hypothetical protein
MDKSFKTETFKCRSCILVEGPAWNDAEFYGHWLLSAAKANELLQDARKKDAEFRTLFVDKQLLFAAMSAFGGKADMTFCGNTLSRSLLGAKRTCPFALHMSAYDPKPTLLDLTPDPPSMLV